MRDKREVFAPAKVTYKEIEKAMQPAQDHHCTTGTVDLCVKPQLRGTNGSPTQRPCMQMHAHAVNVK